MQESEMNEMTNAFTAMRKYGRNIESRLQDKAHFSDVHSDPKMPGKRLRRYLSQYGLRGDALNTEVKRIMAGPARMKAPAALGEYILWPYGWQSEDFTPMMRRIFKGKSKRMLIMEDEAWLLLRDHIN